MDLSRCCDLENISSSASFKESLGVGTYSPGVMYRLVTTDSNGEKRHTFFETCTFDIYYPHKVSLASGPNLKIGMPMWL